MIGEGERCVCVCVCVQVSVGDFLQAIIVLYDQTTFFFCVWVGKNFPTHTQKKIVVR